MDTIRPGMGSSDLYYMISAGIGSGAGGAFYYLHLDTGSSLSWIQCEPCAKCFHQQPKLFNPQNSPSYLALTANHPFCHAPFYNPGPNGLCEFNIGYADDTSAKGTLSSETFTFPGSQSGYYYMPNIVFGCTHETDTDYPLGGPVGIFGMNLEPESFISQESNDPITDKRFSYCLVEPGSTTPMTLRFGDDITWPPVTKIQETPILRYSNGFKLYYVNLTGISIDKTGMYFPPGTFDRDPFGYRGFMIDSGAHYSYLPKTAYPIVREGLVNHFEGLHIVPTEGRGFNEKFDLCFDLPENADPANLLPSMTFNFAGADMALFYEQVFYVNLQEKQFCLAMFEEETGLAPGVLGAFQQVNTQFEFDLRQGGVLRLGTVDCTHGV